VFLSCAPAVSLVPDSGSKCGCDKYSTVQQGAQVPQQLPELSGLVSASTAGVFFALNDSGDAARVFRIESNVAQPILLSGTVNVDFEDLSRGPCGPNQSDSCLFVADIGDNLKNRSDYAVQIFPEPAVDATQTAVKTIRFVYPMNQHFDAETFMVHPLNGAMYLLTKEIGVSHVFKFPLNIDSASTVTLVPLGELVMPSDFGLVTAGSISECGNRMLIRSYKSLAEYKWPGAASDFDNIFSSTPAIVPVANEEQGEAVAYLPNGMGYVTAGETFVSKVFFEQVNCR
jgi:hypothetical protein